MKYPFLKAIFSLVLLVPALATFAQTAWRSPGGELKIAYLRGTQKLHDLQASPVFYFTTYNGVNIDYSRSKNRNLWEFGMEAKTGTMLAPALGEREFLFEEGGDAFLLVPSQYFGELRAGYQRQLNSPNQHRGYLGVWIRDEIYYADGLSMNTWAMNNLEISVRYTQRWNLGKRHLLAADISLPVIAWVSRMPYSNVVSYPDKSQTKGFLQEAKLATIAKFQHPEVQLSYRYRLAERSGLEVRYAFDWLRYSEPQTIRKTNHEASLAWIYQFHFSSKN